MAFYDKFPYTNFQELNLDWITQEVSKVRDNRDATDASAAAALASERAAKASETAAAASQQAAANSETAAAGSEAASAEYLAQIGTHTAGAVADWLKENLQPTTPPIDESLTVSGAAADAKVAGDRISDLNAALNTETSARVALAGKVTTLETHKVAQPLDEYNQPTDGTDGQSLRTKGDGTTEWADVGLPTDEQTAQAISYWLNDHPEATTTVQDWSLTYKKLVKGTLGYVFPEMYGAVGDGKTDDAPAFRLAFTAKKPVLLLNHYKISTVLEIPNTSPIVYVGGYFDVDAFDTDTQTGGWVYFNNPAYPITPQMFGAKADGTADDYKAVQNAVDANLNPIVFPIGKTQSEAETSHTYYNSLTVELNGKFLISDTIIIRAEQHFNKLLITSGQHTADIIGVSRDINNLDDCAIRIVKPDDYPSGDVDTQTQKTISNIRFLYFKTGIENNGTDWECRIIKNAFQNISDNAIKLISCSGTWVEDNYASWCYGWMVNLSYCNACIITGNHSGETGGLGNKGIASVNGSGAGNRITNNYIRNIEARHSEDIIDSNTINGEVTINGVSNVQITNNKVRKVIVSSGSGHKINNNIMIGDSNTTGILVDDTAGNSEICNNTIKGFAIGINSYKESLISGNNFIENTVSIQMKNGGRNNQIIGNKIQGGTSGIKFASNNTRTAIIANMFLGVATALDVVSSEVYAEYAFADGNSFINCTTVNATNMSSQKYSMMFGINYSTQKGMVNGNVIE